MLLTPRPYQLDAHNAVLDYWSGGGGNPLVVIPTGGGKSLIIARFVEEAIRKYPGTRILILTHVAELIVQNFSELIGLWPEAPAGIYSASVGLKQIDKQVIFAGIQSIHRKAIVLQNIDIVIVDEAHLIPRNSDTMYRRFLNDLLKINPNMRVMGLTATEFRTDSGMLYEGEDAIFDCVAYKCEISYLINEGYLCPLSSRSARTQLDTSKVGTRSGDFIPKQLEAVATNQATVNAIADEIVLNSEGRKGILIFGSGINATRMLADAMTERGIFTECAFGDTDSGTRSRLVSQFKARQLRSLACYGLFTTGFNARHVDLIAMVRATKSRGLYIQIAGRGTRPTADTSLPTRDERLVAIEASGKAECLVLDFGGNIERHGPIDNPKPLRGKGKGGGGMPSKACPNPMCGEPNPISARTCSFCGAEFPEPESKVATEASTLDIMSRADLSPEWIDVTSIEYRRHRKAGSPDSLRVTYECGLLHYPEWVCLEHEGRARGNAVVWWRRRAGNMVPVPLTIGEALDMAHNLARPKQIALRPAGKFTEVVGHRYFDMEPYEARIM